MGLDLAFVNKKALTKQSKSVGMGPRARGQTALRFAGIPYTVFKCDWAQLVWASRLCELEGCVSFKVV